MLLNGRAPLPGELMTFPTLAQSFRQISTNGKHGFYKGRIAEEIVRVVKSKGGVMELEDLARHKTDFVDPIKYTYRGEITVYEVSGIILLDENLLKGLVPSEWTRYTSTNITRDAHSYMMSRNHSSDGPGHLGTPRNPRVGKTIQRDDP
jgi:gamma-glutamyltranspeptidase